MTKASRKAGLRGQDAVEFALLLPVLLLIMFGVIDLGRILHAAITITNAAREGARYGTMFPTDEVGIRDAVVAEAAGSSIDLSDAAGDAAIVITCPAGSFPTNCPRGEPIRVEITYQFELIMLMVFSGPQLPVFSYAEMMVP